MITQLAGHSGAMWEIVGEKERELGNALVIDLGGGQGGWGRADWLVDLKSYDKREGVHGPERFTRDTWIQADLNDYEWADRFPDKQFDLVFCNHTLEDIRDPIGLLKVITRIGKRALIGTPHWSFEVGVRWERDDWEAISGFPHHRWLVGINKRTGAYEFMAKLCWFVKSDYEVTQPNFNIEWDGGDFEFADISYWYPGNSKKAELVAWLEDRWL